MYWLYLCIYSKLNNVNFRHLKKCFLRVTQADMKQDVDWRVQALDMMKVKKFSLVY